MTVVEFFACSPLENMISCFSLKPDKVIFVGDGRKMRRRVEAYEKIAKRLGINAVFQTVTVQRNSVNAIANKLIEIVETEQDCCFDLTGGDDLALVAMGVVFEKYKGKRHLQMQRFNISTGKITDCDNDGEVPALYSDVALTGQEYIALHGGKIMDRVVYNPDNNGDMSTLWGVCRARPRVWNRAVNTLGEFVSASYENGGGTQVFIDKRNCCVNSEKISRFNELKDFIKVLETKELVNNVKETATEYRFCCKNSFVKKCISKAGVVLEQTVLSVASEIKTKQGARYYNNCLSGVVLDWDGVPKNENGIEGTVNEIDCLLMKKLTPVFISCKNGAVDDSELYKLASVAERFGGAYAKKALVLSGLTKKGKSKQYFLQRANDMGIRVIENAHKLTKRELEEKIKNI